MIKSLLVASVFSISGNDVEDTNDLRCIYNHRTTKTNQKYPSVNL